MTVWGRESDRSFAPPQLTGFAVFTEGVTYVSDTMCNPCVRAGP